VEDANGLMYWGTELGSTELMPSHYSIDLDTWQTDLTHEFNISVEREIMKDFAVSLGFNYKDMGGSPGRSTIIRTGARPEQG